VSIFFGLGGQTCTSVFSDPNTSFLAPYECVCGEGRGWGCVGVWGGGQRTQGWGRCGSDQGRIGVCLLMDRGFRSLGRTAPKRPSDSQNKMRGVCEGREPGE